MRTKTILVILSLCFWLSGTLCPVVAADDLEKSQKKEMEAQAKAMMREAQQLEKSGQLTQARTKYAESQALIEMDGVTDALKHLDDEIRKRVRDALNEAHKLYEARKYQEAAAVLDQGMKLEAYQAVLSYDLALCYHQLGDRAQAVEYMRKASAGTPDRKEKQRLLQLLTFLTTGESGASVSNGDKDRVNRVNVLAESVGLDGSLEDEGGAEETFADGEAVPAGGGAGQLVNGAAATTPAKTDKPAGTGGASTNAARRSSLCIALADLKVGMASSPATTFNLGNCSETNGRTAEAVALLEKYVALTPTALDAEESRARIADLRLLMSLPGQNGADVRRLYAAAYGSLAERKYDRALAGFTRAGDLAPEFAPTKWKLALLYEAMGNVDGARQNFTRYKELTPDQNARDEADLHLTTLEAKRMKYDEEVDEAGDIISDLFNRAMNLTFNGDENRSALRAKRARVKKKNERAKAKGRVGGFAVPYAYAQQQLGRASEHLQIALALFPLGAEANELMGLVFLQANDGHSATKNFDVVASQGLPVAFYAEMRGHNLDHAVKCELNRDGLRMIFLSTYDKNGKATPPTKPAGEDGLGDLTVEPAVEREQGFDALELKLADIKKVETDKGLLKLKLTKQEFTLAPIYLPSFTPIEGPQARRFANNYTRLFVRYPGLEDSKLGTEGMSGGEKFKMGYNIAMASMDIASSGFNPIGAISSVQDIVSIALTIRTAVVSLSVSLAAWERTVDDEQQLLAGKAFKSIPSQPVNLAFVQDTK